MKKNNQVGSQLILPIINKAYKYNNGKGPALSAEEQSVLTAWSEVSEYNWNIAGRLTGPDDLTNFNITDWCHQRQRIGYYEHLVNHFFKDAHPEKIKRDNEIIWLMAERMLTKVEGRKQKNFKIGPTVPLSIKASMTGFKKECSTSKEAKRKTYWTRMPHGKTMQKNIISHTVLLKGKF